MLFRSYLVDQLVRGDRRRGAIAANIAEGSGEKAGPERLRFYRMSRRSATECSAVLDVIGARQLEAETQLPEGKLLIHRIIAMLTVLARINRGG